MKLLSHQRSERNYRKMFEHTLGRQVRLSEVPELRESVAMLYKGCVASKSTKDIVLPQKLEVL